MSEPTNVRRREWWWTQQQDPQVIAATAGLRRMLHDKRIEQLAKTLLRQERRHSRGAAPPDVPAHRLGCTARGRKGALESGA